MNPGIIGLLTGRLRRPAIGTSALLAALLSALVIVGCGGGGGDSTPVTPTDPTTATGFTSRGWERFEAANFSGALSDFNDAIDLDATHGPAHAGQGWARLAMATSSIAMQTAITSFGTAVANGEGGAYVVAGRAAAQLGSGGTSLDSAVTDAQAALAADASFVFSHRTSFNAADLRLIEAFAKAAQGNFSGALVAADLVLDSGIGADNSATWQVDGTSYGTFVGAVLAHLHKLSGQYSG